MASLQPEVLGPRSVATLLAIGDSDGALAGDGLMLLARSKATMLARYTGDDAKARIVSMGRARPSVDN